MGLLAWLAYVVQHFNVPLRMSQCMSPAPITPHFLLRFFCLPDPVSTESAHSVLAWSSFFK